MNTKQLNRIFSRAIYGMVIVAMVLSISTVVYAAPPSPFLGKWEAVDVDGSDMVLAVGGPANGPFQITWTDDYISYCNGEASIIRGTGLLNVDDSNLMVADLYLKCLTTGETLNFQLTFRFHQTTNTMSFRYENGAVVIWHRPGGGQVQEPPELGLRVNYQDNWVESFYETGHTVWITVTEADGNLVKAMAEVSTDYYPDGGFGTEGMPEVWSPEPPDIEPNDWVYAWVDNGASSQMQVGEINPTADLENNFVQGTISAGWFDEEVYVSCNVWGYEDADDYMVMPNGDDAFFCDWDGTVDINPGDVAEIWYWGPDGNAVGYYLYIPNPTFVAYMQWTIVGYDWPIGNNIDISINDDEYFAQAQVGNADWDPAVVLFELSQDDFYMEAGDHIVMTDEDTGMTKEVWVTNLAVTDFDLEANEVFGTYGPAYDLQVWFYDIEEQIPETYPDGTWVATFTALPPGAWGGATQWDEDGDGTSIDFQVPVTFVVSSTEDVMADDGFCTLREAIIAANTNSPSGETEGECPAGTDSQTDTILLASNQTYSLTIDSTYEDDSIDGDLDIWDNSAATDLIIMVEGNGIVTISQDAEVDDRVMEVHGATTQIEGLTLIGGSNVEVGGGVHNADGTLIMNFSTLSGNMAEYGGGIYNDSSGTLILSNSTVSGNTANVDGGGLENGGMLTVDASTFFANSATYGGGALATYNGEVTIRNGSLFGGDPYAGQGNTANYGGGIAIWSGNLTLTDSMVSGNSVTWVGGAIRNASDGWVTISASTISNNSADWDGGGILNEGAMIVDTSDVSDNTATYQGGGIGNYEGDLTISASTISGNSSGNGGGMKNWPNSTLVIDGSTFASNHASGGGGLDNEGGTAKIQNGSQFTGNAVGWIGGAISNVGGGALLVEGSSIISGNSSDGFAGGLYNDPASTLTVNDSTTASNISIYGGGGMMNEGMLTVENSVLSANTSGQGGALYNPGTANIINTTVGGLGDDEGNIGTDGGGGLFNLGTMTVDSSIVSGNWAPYGGGLFNWIDGMLTINGSTVSGNSANQGGGLNTHENSTTVIQNGSIIVSNTANWAGGGVNNWGMLTITDSSLRDNTSLTGVGNAINSDVNLGNAMSITWSCIVGNGGTALFNGQPAIQIATNNWWGDASGPSGAGPGSGDSVSDYVDFSDWLSEPPSICAP